MSRELTVEDIEPIAPAEFLKRLKRLHKKHRRWVLDAMGDPPHPRNVPKELWEKIRREEEAFLTIMLIGFASPILSSLWRQIGRQLEADAEDEDEDDEDDSPAPVPAPLQRRLYRSTRRRSAWSARHITRTTRRRLNDSWQRQRDSGADPDPAVAVDDAFSDARAETIARTELVNAGNQPAIAVRNEYAGPGPNSLRVFTAWRLGESCEHCEACPMLEGLEIAQTSLLTDIPVHPNCCCYYEVLIGKLADLRAAGMIRVATQSELNHIQRVLDKMGLLNPTRGIII